MKLLKLLFTLLMITGIILTACSATPPKLEGSSWILSSLSGMKLDSDISVTLIFENGNVSGSDGCNRYNGSFTHTGNALKIGPDIVSTMMACDAAVMQQASEYQTILPQVKSFKIENNQLSLYDLNGNELALFIKQDTELKNTSWQITAFNNGNQAVTSILPESEITINFKNDGTIEGNAGCNIFSGNYLTEGVAISVRNIQSTEKACLQPDGIMEQETQFLIALNSIKTYRIEGNNLEFRNADDAIALSMIKKQLN